MSTRCRIGILQDDGAIRSIYCHFDGYPAGVGMELLDSYTEVDKINKLLDLGDISSLGSEPVSDPSYWDMSASFDTSTSKFHAMTIVTESRTFAYRDRGEDCPAVISKNASKYYKFAADCGCDYAYLFSSSDKTWKFCNLYSKKKYYLESFLKKSRKTINYIISIN